MARAIRTTVNLLLVVILTIQPSIACVLQRSCSSDGTPGNECPGCGCCEVESKSDRCSCCRHPEHRKDATHSEESDCCGYRSSQGTADVDCDDDSEQTAALNSPSVRPECLCFRNPAPLGEPVPPSPLNKIRDQIIRPINFVAADSKERFPSNLGYDVVSVAATLDSTQITLCVWQL